MTGHRTSAVYSLALAELRANHIDEFEAIYQRMLAEKGIETQQQQRERLWAETCEIIRARPGIGLDELATLLGVHRNSAFNYVKALADVGIVTRPGSGNGGFRLAEADEAKGAAGGAA